MSSVTTYFCDKCKKQVNNALDLTGIYVYITVSYRSCTHEWASLCKPCIKELEKILGKEKPRSY